MDFTRPSGMTVLYLDADTALRQQVAVYLEGYGFAVVQADRPAEVRELLAAHRFDVVVLDAALPSDDGSLLIRDVATRFDAAVVVTSSRAEEAERILALEAGADHYLVKPFGFRALVAHVRAACRRAAPRRPNTGRRVARFAEWSVDLAAHRADTPDRGVDLTSGETAILRVLLERPLQVFSRARLLSSTRRDDSEVFDRTVDVLISRLRHKLERDPLRPEFIQTIRGEGYRFSVPVRWETD
jgi:DNA-binding response OmpR family regulator